MSRWRVTKQQKLLIPIEGEDVKKNDDARTHIESVVPQVPIESEPLKPAEPPVTGTRLIETKLFQLHFIIVRLFIDWW